MAEITADILDRAPGPALTATSDMPVPDAPSQEPAANVAEAAPAPEPVSEAPAAEGEEGEAGPEGEAEAAGESAEPVEPPRPPKRIGPVQQRVNELTAERKVEAAKREAAEAHALRLEKLLADALANKETKPAEFGTIDMRRTTLPGPCPDLTLAPIGPAQPPATGGEGEEDGGA